MANPGNITASHNLFNTADAQNKFAVQRNIGTDPLTPWTANIALNVGASAISLTNVTLNAYITNGAGNFQTVGRDLDMSVLLLDAGLNPLSTTTINNIYTHGGGSARPQNADFDLSGNTLSANTNYVIQIKAFSNVVWGNNAGFDDLSINGEINAVPEPTSLLTFAGLGICAGFGGWRRRRKKAA